MIPIHAGYVRALAIRQQLVRSRLLLGRPRTKLNVPRIVAVHFPKAGGSSLARQFDNILGSGLLLNYADDPVLGRTLNKRTYPTGKAMVFGHFHPATYDSADAFRMTFLRHPVDNLLSIYAFWKATPAFAHRVQRKFLDEKPSVLEFCRYDGFRNLMSETYFGGFDMRRFDFIGFDETRTADLASLSEAIGANISSDVHCNQTAYTVADDASRHDYRLRSRMADIVRADVSFYEAEQKRVRQSSWLYVPSYGGKRVGIG